VRLLQADRRDSPYSPDRNTFDVELDALMATVQSHVKNLRARARARMSDSAFLVRFVTVGIWFFCTSYINALGAVVAGHRTPRQPPLPDVAHEILPVEYIHSLLGASLVRFLPDCKYLFISSPSLPSPSVSLLMAPGRLLLLQHRLHDPLPLLGREALDHSSEVPFHLWLHQLAQRLLRGGNFPSRYVTALLFPV
jgi:hypothetical protein